MKHSIYHVAMSNNLILNGIKYQPEIWKDVITDSKTGKPIPLKQAEKEIKELQKRGLKYFPPCNNCDKEGRCKGHTVKPKIKGKIGTLTA
jgi:hypothetical protein